jgi:glyoxylase-like metal-dependent hydrolase (beta-lactamase superfamily II)
LATSRRWTTPRPINVYVIEHREGLVVFDTGQDRASVTDPSYFPTGLTGVLYQRLAQFDIGPDQTLTRQLSAIGYDVADVRTAVLSPLHQDHIGGLPELHHADIVVSEQKWKALQRPPPELRGFLRSHTDLPGLWWHRVRAEKLDDHDLAPFDGGHDVFADGSLILLPTPGHTPGSMSLLVRRPSHASLMLVGDLTYDADLLAAGHVPGAGDKTQMRKAIASVNALRQRFPELTVLAAHDPTAADRLATSLCARP